MISLRNTSGKLLPPVTDEELHVAQSQLAVQFPNDYAELLRASNGISLNSGGIIYSSGQLVERNMTYEVFQYAPGMLAIGDDGGGKLILISLKLSTSSAVYFVDSGALGAVIPSMANSSLETWANVGFPLQVSTGEESPDFGDLYLVAIPAEGVKSLLGIKDVLGINLSLLDMNRGTQSLPFLLAARVPFGKYQKRCEKVNRSYGDCVEIRPSP